MSFLLNPYRFGVAFDPTTIAGCKLYADASNPSGFTYSSGTLVSLWPDLSGNANNLPQSTVSQQPDRSGAQNGLTTVVFDGSNDRVVSGAINLGTACTLFVVCTPTSGSEDYLCSHADSDGVPQLSLITKWNPGSGVKAFEAFGYDGSGSSRCTIGSGSETGYHLITITRSGTAVTTRIDASASNSMTLNSNYSLNYPISIGSAGNPSSEYAAAGVAALIAYDTALGTTDRDAVETHLRAKWGTP